VIDSFKLSPWLLHTVRRDSLSVSPCMVSPTITNDNNNNNISINSRSFKTLLCSKVASDSPGVTKCEKAGDDYDDDCDHGNDEDEDDVNNNNDKWETTLRRDQDIFQESLRKAPGPW